MLWLEDGDHDLRPRKAVSGLTAADHLRTDGGARRGLGRRAPGLRIATFNVNNVVKRLGNLLAWLEATAPDVVCLQELKAAEPDFPAAALAEAGYGAVWRGQRAWNGVAILASGAEPVLTRDALPGDATTGSRATSRRRSAGVLVGCLYAPNGNPAPGPKFAYKLAWHARFEAHAAELLATGLPVVLAGDYNIVPEPRDIYPTTLLRRQRADPAGEPGGICAAARPGVDRCAARGLSRRDGLYVLGLPAEPVGAERRDASRPPAAEPRARPRGWLAPASTARHAARRTPATMRRPGSSSRRAERQRPAAVRLPWPVRPARRG